MQIEYKDGSFDKPVEIENLKQIQEALNKKNVKKVHVFNMDSEEHKRAIERYSLKVLNKKHPKGWKKEIKKRAKIRKKNRNKNY